MASIAELVEEIKSDRIKNGDLIVCLEAKNLRVVAMAMLKLIKRNYCDYRIVDRLAELGEHLIDNKFIGPGNSVMLQSLHYPFWIMRMQRLSLTNFLRA